MIKRYRAFISYAHSDERWARWLQNALETYRVPRKLRLQYSDSHSLPPRLYPVFRDREDLASASDLSDSIQTALRNSDALIVICSPAAVQSRWANREIQYFQSLGRQDRIFCLIVEGNPERESSDCAFPPSLLFDEKGSALPDPLAADVSRGGDGRRNALLKIIAGLLSVDVDDLVQRDAQRQLRIRTAIAAASLVVAMVTIAFAIVAHLAREEADLRRSQAENLISFMLEDLRGRLEPVGRLDLLDAVGNEAMEYFAVLGNRGTEQDVFTRAMALRQIGEVRFRQGQLEAAQSAFQDSRDILVTLYADSPQQQHYLFELGQAEFWLGYAVHEQSKLDESGLSYRRYMEYSRELLAADPDNPDYLLELMYAYSNLGGWELDRANPVAALDNFQQCLALNQQLVLGFPDDDQLVHELANTYSWIGETRLQLGSLRESLGAYQRAVELLEPIHALGENRIVSENYGQNNYHLGNVFFNLGDMALAQQRFELAMEVFEDLVSLDGENAIWRSDRGISAFHLAQLMQETGEIESAEGLLLIAIDDFQLSITNNPGDLRVVEYHALTQQQLARLWGEGVPEEAMQLSSEAHNSMQNLLADDEVKPRTVLNAAIVANSHGRFLNTAGQRDAAISTWQQAVDMLDQPDNRELQYVAVKRQLQVLLGDVDSATELEVLLSDAGFNDPRFL